MFLLCGGLSQRWVAWPGVQKLSVSPGRCNQPGFTFSFHCFTLLRNYCVFLKLYSDLVTKQGGGNCIKVYPRGQIVKIHLYTGPHGAFICKACPRQFYWWQFYWWIMLFRLFTNDLAGVLFCYALFWAWPATPFLHMVTFDRKVVETSIWCANWLQWSTF